MVKKITIANHIRYINFNCVEALCNFISSFQPQYKVKNNICNNNFFFVKPLNFSILSNVILKTLTCEYIFKVSNKILFR